MKTILINVPFSLEVRYGKKMQAFGAVSEPLGLAYLAGNLEKFGHNVEIIDAPALGLDIDQVVKRVSESGARLVGLSFLTPMYDVIKELSSKLKIENPDILIIAGGPHASALPKETLNEIPDLDFVCIGEGERLIVELVNRLTQKGDVAAIDGLGWREKDGVRLQLPEAKSEPLDNLPPPARHLLPMDRYRLTASRTSGGSFCPTLIVARGCPFKCSFCSHLFGRTFRHHSVERIIGELKELKDLYGVEQVNLEADTLTLNRKFLYELCDAMIDAKLDLRWTCESRVDTVDEDLLKRMKMAGCWQISYGVETGSEKLLQIILKGVTKDQVRKTFAITKRVGISIRGFFMLGLPDETPTETEATILFAKELDPFWAQFTVTIPYPGTPMFKQLKADGKIRHFDWSQYNTWGGWAGSNLPYLPEGRSEEDLKIYQKRAMRKFYLRPRVLLRFLRSAMNLADLVKYWKGLLTLIRS